MAAGARLVYAAENCKIIVFFAIDALIWLAGGSWVTEPVSTTLALPFPNNLTTKKRRILN
ncbi:hypothetical protein FFY61_02835 [Pediococcus acidilactici]|nr:hypothetical protein GBO41_03175 [Pediococcus acidilactici]KAF0361045.1 hypothetical protein GBO49_02355 [Pediococcus acidilactici]KAF0374723.1 hypothetical protein GBO57_05540 [Pediococcus acidilactici]KAF0380634.1 hypothetical protein GBO61_03490 [Pediococcus acidilactici]KAF0405134.1 hypothetical protein GBO75_05480 [Pediococcus acidilactici]